MIKVETDRTEALHLLKRDVVGAAAGYTRDVLLANDKPGLRAKIIASMVSQAVDDSPACADLVAWLAMKHRKGDVLNIGLAVGALSWGLYIGWCARGCAEGKELNRARCNKPKPKPKQRKL